jgi:hypothetical protein
MSQEEVDRTNAMRSNSTSRLGVYQKLSTVPFEPIQIQGRVSDRLTEAFQKAVPSVNVVTGEEGTIENRGDGERARGSRGSRRKSRERAAMEQQAIVNAAVQGPQQERPSPPKPKKSKVRVMASKRTQESIEEEVRTDEERSSIVLHVNFNRATIRSRHVVAGDD